MSVEFVLTLSDDLNRNLDNLIANGKETDKADIIRKALSLYLVAKIGVQTGSKIGLLNENQVFQQFVGI